MTSQPASQEKQNNISISPFICPPDVNKIVPFIHPKQEDKVPEVKKGSF